MDFGRIFTFQIEGKGSVVVVAFPYLHISAESRSELGVSQSGWKSIFHLVGFFAPCFEGADGLVGE